MLGIKVSRLFRDIRDPRLQCLECDGVYRRSQFKDGPGYSGNKVVGVFMSGHKYQVCPGCNYHNAEHELVRVRGRPDGQLHTESR